MTNRRDLGIDAQLRLGRNVDLREEHFGSIIYRTKLFDLKELNHFGTLICRLIQRSPITTIRHLSETIETEYGTPSAEAGEDLKGFLASLIDKGFIVIGDTCASTSIRIDPIPDGPLPSAIIPEDPLPDGLFREVRDSLEAQWDSLPEQGFYSAPLQFHWEITHQCNLRCMHCYASATPVVGDENGEVDTLDWEKCLVLMETLHGMGVVQINFLGGEPMIERKFLSLLEKAEEYGFDIAFPSNGLLFTREKLLRLKELGMEYVTISLDSADPLVFEDLRGMQGIFRKVMDNIKLAKNLGLGVIVNTVLTRKNMDGFEELIKLLISMEVDILKVIDEFPVGRGLVNMDKLLLEPHDYREFYRMMLTEIEPRYRDRLDIQLSPRFAIRQELELSGNINEIQCDEMRGGELIDSVMWKDGKNDTVAGVRQGAGIRGGPGDQPVDYRCSAGRSQCFCDANWNILPCYLFYGEKEFIVGNVLDQPFDRIWSDPGSFRCFRVPVGSIPECEGCGFAESCKGGCRGDAYKFTRDFLAGNPYCWNLNTGD